MEKVIKCPHCGYEYLPEEIFYGVSYLGDASNIVRDEEGKIIHYTGTSMPLTETYCCDKCLTNFKVESEITYTTSEVVDFDEDEYVSEIYSDRVELNI